MAELIDTNVILRFLVGDIKKQYDEVVGWFKEAEKGKRKLKVKTIVVAEACFVLESFYKESRENIASKFEVFLSQKWLSVENREELVSLWKWYRKNFHFVDSFLLATAEAKKYNILTFDQGIRKELKPTK